MSLKPFILSITFLLLWQCGGKNFYFEETSPLKNNWKADDVRTFSLPVKQVKSKYTLYFILRNNNDYPYSNIYFFTELISPDGKSIIDTIEYQLARPDGKWKGDGMGSVKQNTLVYKEKIALQDSGVYKINISHAMREDNLRGLEDISLMVEKN